MMIPFMALFFFGILQNLQAAPAPQMTGEIRSYHQVGDQIKGEYSRLHPDGSVTKTLAFGDTKQGLQYKSYQMDPLGNVKTVDVPNQQIQINQPDQQQAQLNQPDQPQAQLNQGQAQSQLTGQIGQAPAGQQTMSPGVNWFMQQPLVSQMDPFGVNPFAAPANPFLQTPVQDPLLAANPLLSNPLWNFWNF